MAQYGGDFLPGNERDPEGAFRATLRTTFNLYLTVGGVRASREFDLRRQSDAILGKLALADIPDQAGLQPAPLLENNVRRESLDEELMERFGQINSPIRPLEFYRLHEGGLDLRSASTAREQRETSRVLRFSFAEGMPLPLDFVEDNEGNVRGEARQLPLPSAELRQEMLLAVHERLEGLQEYLAEQLPDGTE